VTEFRNRNTALQIDLPVSTDLIQISDKMKQAGPDPQQHSV